MIFNSTWEIGVLMDSYATNLQIIQEQPFVGYERYVQKDKLKATYLKAIELTLEDNCGLIMPIDMCIEWVKDGSIIDYDGTGYLLDAAGERTGYSRCNVAFLKKAKKNGTVFIAWYNK